MMDQVIKRILRDYEDKRSKSKTRKIKRIQEIYNRIPRIKEIDDEIQRIGVSITRAILVKTESPEILVNKLKVQLESLKQEKAFLLTENNIPIQYLEDEYSCSYCKDTGFVGGGKRCSCFKQQLINSAYSMSNLEGILNKENFKTFDIELFSNNPFMEYPLTPRENMMDILQVCEGYTINFDRKNEDKDNLLFFGDTGLGKSFLANCIAKALLDKGKLVVYQTAFKIFEIIENVRFHNKQDKDKYDLLFSCDLLIVDDLGTEITNSFTNSELFNIINSRLMSKSKTIISTNLQPMDFGKRYDDRIASRIFSNYKVLEFYGKDLRWQT
ncbi:ATP-binding protein [Alkaliphilus serpentinus]|uniref:DNA replication protein DnaC n=1 Tax=Alkaliphilus serpentinus TaxID=1482731 RepID=A0A833HQQ4_9FIRM|nr:ATP-binding protein [Alkaliphilus serpentinus]KAB3532187.1 DNA replication protein DnaC [Alkaliphilus serpentinus]